MSARRVFGVETEYAVTALDGAGAAFPRGDFTAGLLAIARKQLSHLPDGHSTGLFLANGSRFYIDAGDHPEVSSPECLDPWDVVRYSKAGDLILEQLAEGVRTADPRIARVLIFKGNVDYSAATTWGAHESYGHRAHVGVLQRRLMPHLVSRVIYTGAGGFNPFSHGLEFMLSPRVAHLTHAFSAESTTQRSIIHTRDESLAAHGYRRQHLICGESARSDVATWLKVGATALVVAMIEAGVPCGEDVALAAPLEALRTFARDPGGRETAAMASRPPMTALQIQRRYLDRAVHHAGDRFMPKWAGAVCERWADVLDRLERGPAAVASRLDWAMKWKIYEERARRRGIEWATTPAWTHVVETLERARLDAVPRIDRLSVDLVLARAGPLRAAVTALASYVDAHGLRWRDLDEFLSLRQQLFEVDTRFGELGANSLFSILDASGVLDHQVDDDAMPDARYEPPAAGRARVRGAVIRDAARERRRLVCTWEAIWDPATDAHLDLSDPFSEREVWERSTSATSPSASDRNAWLWGEVSQMLSPSRRTR